MPLNKNPSEAQLNAVLDGLQKKLGLEKIDIATASHKKLVSWLSRTNLLVLRKIYYDERSGEGETSGIRSRVTPHISERGDEKALSGSRVIFDIDIHSMKARKLRNLILDFLKLSNLDRLQEIRGYPKKRKEVFLRRHMFYEMLHEEGVDEEGEVGVLREEEKPDDKDQTKLLKKLLKEKGKTAKTGGLPKPFSVLGAAKLTFEQTKFEETSAQRAREFEAKQAVDIRKLELLAEAQQSKLETERVSREKVVAESATSIQQEAAKAVEKVAQTRLRLEEIAAELEHVKESSDRKAEEAKLGLVQKDIETQSKELARLEKVRVSEEKSSTQESRVNLALERANADISQLRIDQTARENSLQQQLLTFKSTVEKLTEENRLRSEEAKQQRELLAATKDLLEQTEKVKLETQAERYQLQVEQLRDQIEQKAQTHAQELQNKDLEFQSAKQDLFEKINTTRKSVLSLSNEMGGLEHRSRMEGAFKDVTSELQEIQGWESDPEAVDMFEEVQYGNFGAYELPDEKRAEPMDISEKTIGKGLGPHPDAKLFSWGYKDNRGETVTYSKRLGRILAEKRLAEAQTANFQAMEKMFEAQAKMITSRESRPAVARSKLANTTLSLDDVRREMVELKTKSRSAVLNQEEQTDIEYLASVLQQQSEKMQIITDAASKLESSPVTSREELLKKLGEQKQKEVKEWEHKIQQMKDELEKSGQQTKAKETELASLKKRLGPMETQESRIKEVQRQLTARERELGTLKSQGDKTVQDLQRKLSEAKLAAKIPEAELGTLRKGKQTLEARREPYDKRTTNTPC